MECTQLSLFGRTYQELFPATAEKISEPCWKSLPAWNSQTLLFLDLRGGGRWSKAGAIAGAGWSLAWRQFDAQHWGVPQRRKRIALVADFGDQRASEILFERTGVSGHPDEGIQTWKSVAGLAKNCAAGNDRVVAEGGAERSLYLENTFRMRRRRQGRTGTNGENRDAIDAPRPDALPTSGSVQSSSLKRPGRRQDGCVV